MAEQLRFDGKVAIVTGAGNGLGRAYALLLASRGAKVLVNDLGGSVSGGGSDSSPADRVVSEIIAAGGSAAANYDSVEAGDKIVADAVKAFGTVDIVVNNAGILRDKTFLRMSDADWDIINKVHLRGSYAVTKAAWPIMREKKYGRVIFVTSCAGLYGNVGQANYSAAKMALVGFGNTLAKEGASSNIKVNCIAPVAASRMTESLLQPHLQAALTADAPSALVAVLTHDSCPVTGGVVEVGAKWFGAVRLQRAFGHTFAEVTPENLLSLWDRVVDYTDPVYPTGLHDSLKAMTSGLPRTDIVTVAQYPPAPFSYTEKDLVTYAIGTGATELKFTYEMSEGFSALPTFPVTFANNALKQIIMGGVPGLKPFSFASVLHGEHELVLHAPIPTSGSFVTRAHIPAIYDKGSGALVYAEAHTEDSTGTLIATNLFKLFIVGGGGFGGQRGPSNALATPPARSRDSSVTYQTSEQQAVVYRLSGDVNPLHVDPSAAQVIGFDKPILHGLCSLAISTRAVLARYGANDASRVRSVKTRFAKHVFPGEKLVTDMWREGNTVYFRTSVPERNVVVLDGGVVELTSVTDVPSARL